MTKKAFSLKIFPIQHLSFLEERGILQNVICASLGMAF